MSLLYSKRLLLIVGLAAAFAMSFTGSNLVSSASAATYDYCGYLVAVDVWCTDNVRHTYDYNSASYTGGGLVYVNERFRYDSNNNTYSQVNGYTFVSGDIGANASTLFKVDVRHQYSTTNHTIYGYAIA